MSFFKYLADIERHKFKIPIMPRFSFNDDQRPSMPFRNDYLDLSEVIAIIRELFILESKRNTRVAYKVMSGYLSGGHGPEATGATWESECYGYFNSKHMAEARAEELRKRFASFVNIGVHEFEFEDYKADGQGDG